MFNDLTNLSYTRKKWQIVGFYVAYLMLLMMVSMFAANVVGMVLGRTEDIDLAYKLGIFVSVAYCVFLSGLIAHSKNVLESNTSYALIFLSGILAALGGGILGLIPAAYFTRLIKRK